MLDEAKLKELQKASPTAIHPVTVYGHDVVVRAPSRMEYRQWKADTRDERKKLDAPEMLLTKCLVFPSIAELNALLEAKPALVDTLALEVLKAAGLDEEVEKKEL